MTPLQEQILEKYVLGDLNPEERASFRKQMIDNHDVIDMLDTHDQSELLLKSDTWLQTDDDTQIREAQKRFQTQDVKNFSENMRAVMEEGTSDKVRFLKPSWLYKGIAAAILLLLALNVFMDKSPQQLYKSYDSWEDLPSVVVKAENAENDLMQLEQDFNNQKYNEVISRTDQMMVDGAISSHLLLHRGVAFLELEQSDKALIAFQTLINSDLIDNHMGYWYTALTHLKNGNTDQALKSLHQIAENKNNFNYQKAVDLISTLQ